MKQRILSLLLNPYVIALLVSVVVISFLPDYFSKYHVKIVTKELANDISNLIYYEDLNGDNNSEKIISQVNDFGDASFLLYKSNGDLIDQYNFTAPYAGDYKYLWFQDVNKNGFREIYAVTQSNDSLFLNVFEPYGDGLIDHNNIFIDKVLSFNDQNSVRLGFCSSFNRIKSNEPDVVFTLNAGYSCYPRFAYKYDYKKNNIIKSEYLTNPSGILYSTNLDEDLENEYLIANSSAANDSVLKFSSRSDYSTWFYVLDNDLNFLFEPIEFKAIGAVKTVPVITDSGIKLITLFTSRQPERIPSKLIEYTVYGEIKREVVLPTNNFSNLILTDTNEICVNDIVSGNVLFFNTSLNQLTSYQVSPDIGFLEYYDIDNDGFREWIGFHRGYKYLSIYRERFKHEVTFKTSDIENQSISLNLGIKKINDNEHQMYFQRRQKNTLFLYGNNPMYVFRYGVYLGVYALILGFVWLIIKGQKLREAKQRAIEDQIAELQIKTVKNQVDPHFLFNAINTISEMTLADNKMEADDFICRFSAFMRQTLQNSDKISTTLKGELDYTENFMKLQEIRYNNSFNFNISVDRSVNTETKVPKHVLYTYVENAIKHGLRHTTKKGMIEIKAIKDIKGLLLTVEDNGTGLKEFQISKMDSTGNGLLIMEKIYSLYSKLNKKKITHKLVELFDDSHKKRGLRVEILIEKI